jgi:hypothetical protein
MRTCVRAHHVVKSVTPFKNLSSQVAWFQVAMAEALLSTLITCDFSFSNLVVVLKVSTTNFLPPRPGLVAHSIVHFGLQDILSQLKKSNDRCTRMEGELLDKQKQIMVSSCAAVQVLLACTGSIDP